MSGRGIRKPAGAVTICRLQSTVDRRCLECCQGISAIVVRQFQERSVDHAREAAARSGMMGTAASPRSNDISPGYTRQLEIAVGERVHDGSRSERISAESLQAVQDLRVKLAHTSAGSRL